MHLRIYVLGLELIDIDWTTDTTDEDDEQQSFGGTVGIAAILENRAQVERDGTVGDIQ